MNEITEIRNLKGTFAEMFNEEENGVEREVAEEERAAVELLAEVVLLSG